MSFTGTSRIAGPFPGDGAEDEFTFTFKVFSDADVLVVLKDSSGDETTQTITTNYTVAVNTDQNVSPGGVVTMVTPPASGETLTLGSKVAETQPAVLRNQGAYYPRTVEDAFDRSVILSQQLSNKLQRALTFPISDGVALTNALPTAANRANKTIVFDASGNAGVSVDNYVDQVATVAASAAAAASSATDAETAQTAAETAQTAAETAQTAAETAETNAETAETNAETAETNAETAQTAAEAAQALAESAVSSTSIAYNFDSSTTMGDPGSGDFRMNNATISSVTALALDALTAETGSPDLSDWVATWGSASGSNKGAVIVRKRSTPATFAIFTVTAAVTDNTGWLQITVSYVTGNGTFSDTDACYLQFLKTGNDGSLGSISQDIDMNGNQMQWSKGADIASATALPILTDGNYFDVTGTTTITSFDSTGVVGTLIKLHFDAALTLTHHATDLVLPKGANITTAAGDEAEFIEYASGDYRCTKYTRASGIAVGDLADGTDGELITWNSSGAPATVGAGTSGQVLTSNGAGAAPTMQDAAGGGMWSLVSTSAISSSPTQVDVAVGSAKAYKFLMIGMRNSAHDKGMYVRLGSTYTSENYAWGYEFRRDANTMTEEVGSGTSDSTGMKLVHRLPDNAARDTMVVEITLQDPSNTAVEKNLQSVWWGRDEDGSGTTGYGFGCRKDSLAVIDEVRFETEATSTFEGGTIYCYELIT